MAKTRPFLPTLNEIRSAQIGNLKGHAVAEAFDQVSSAINELHNLVSAIKPTTATTVTQTASPVSSGPGVPTPKPSANAISFGALLSGSNTGATMVVASGASLDFNGTGTIHASDSFAIQGVPISGEVEEEGFVPVAQGDGTAKWGPPNSQFLTWFYN